MIQNGCRCPSSEEDKPFSSGLIASLWLPPCLGQGSKQHHAMRNSRRRLNYAPLRENQIYIEIPIYQQRDSSDLNSTPDRDPSPPAQQGHIPTIQDFESWEEPELHPHERKSDENISTKCSQSDDEGSTRIPCTPADQMKKPSSPRGKHAQAHLRETRSQARKVSHG